MYVKVGLSSWCTKNVWDQGEEGNIWASERRSKRRMKKIVQFLLFNSWNDQGKEDEISSLKYDNLKSTPLKSTLYM
jgi:hypothetical protein